MSPKLRILILNHEFPPLGGGAGRASYYIAKELVKMGDEVDVLTTSDGKLPVFEVVDGVNVHRIYGKRRSVLDNNVIITMTSFLTAGTLKVIRMLKRNQYHVIHCFFTIPAGLVGILVKQMYRIPVIVSLRGSDVPFYNPDEFRLQILALQPLIRFIWKQSNRVVALSEGLRETARKTLYDYDYGVIHNGIDTDVFKPIESFHSNDNNTVKLITVSRLVERKGIQYLLHALAELRAEGVDYQFKLLVVGDGNYRAALEDLTKNLKLEDVISFYGFCPNEKLPELYSSSDIFVLPSLTESFGQVFGEAMACGLPIIGTTVGGIPEVVIDSENGILVQPRDVSALKQALYKLIKNPEIRAKMKQRNVRRIKDQFDWRVTAKQYREIYLKCTAR